MPLRVFARVFGLAFLVIGVCGFIPPLLSPPMPGHTDMVVHQFDGRLFGLFHVNAIHSGLHLLFGVLGLTMSGTLTAARAYAWIVLVGYAGLVVLGLVPQTDTLFGMAPIAGHDVWLHVVLAAVAAPFALLPGRTNTAVVVPAAVAP